MGSQYELVQSAFGANAACESGRCQDPEVCDNGFDDDGDRLADCEDPDCPACVNTSISFFVTSQTNTGDLGGLDGADAICQTLAEAVGSTKSWAAYLSTDVVNARDRIGTGPWRNAEGVMIAADLAALHSIPAGDTELFLDERGAQINGVWEGSPAPVQHDIMTGSDADGISLASEMRELDVRFGERRGATSVTPTGSG